MVEVYDLEITKSAFTYTGLNINTQKISQFVLHKDKSELSEMIAHIKSLKGMIGFNNINFDYPILHYILKEWSIRFTREWTNEGWINIIFDEAQRLINEQSKEAFNQIIAIKTSEVIIPQLDLFKVWHFNNKARMTSLKSLEIAMNLPNVMDMPIDYKRDDITLDEVYNVILPYNLNDVEATYEFYKRSIEKINLRKDLIKIYNLPMINWNDVKIGENIFLKLLSEDMGINMYDLRKMRTERLEIAFKDIILPYIEYKDDRLKKLLDDFKNITIKETKNGFKKSLILQEQIFEYGQGGIHQSCKSGIYESNDKYIIQDIDVKSFYPNIAVINKFRPEHLGESFSKIYSDIYKQRSVIPKKDPRNGAFKLMLNGCFGKAGDKHSFLYDNKFLLSITVNGQLLISMLIDELLQIPNIFFVQSNTDGITIRFDRKHQNLVNEICKKWENFTGLELEYNEYLKMIISDVNNYIAVPVKGDIKYKGRFEIDKDYHKDNSFKIIPIALSEYFVKGIPVEETITNHTNIYDFCGRQKFKGGDYGTVSSIVGDKIVVEQQQKNVRYYISNRGGSFLKNYQKGTSEVINKGYLVTIFNTYVHKQIKEYDINYSFYIKECYKEIDNIIDKQLTLF